MGNRRLGAELMRRALVFLLAWLFLAVQAQAAAVSFTPAYSGSALLAPVSIGTQTASLSASGNVVITTTASVGPGGWISVWGNGAVLLSTYSIYPTGATDQVGNTYVLGASGVEASGAVVYQYVCKGAATPLPAGDTITLAYTRAGSAPTLDAQVAASLLPTVAAQDVVSSGATGTSTSPVVSTGALAASPELIQTATVLTAGGSDTWTEASGFTTFQTVTQAGNNALRIAYQLVTPTTSVIYAPTNSTSRNWAVSLATFR